MRMFFWFISIFCVPRQLLSNRSQQPLRKQRRKLLAWWSWWWWDLSLLGHLMLGRHSGSSPTEEQNLLLDSWQYLPSSLRVHVSTILSFMSSWTNRWDFPWIRQRPLPSVATGIPHRLYCRPLSIYILHIIPAISFSNQQSNFRKHLTPALQFSVTIVWIWIWLFW